MPRKQDLQPLLDVQQNDLGMIVDGSDAIDSKALGMLAYNGAALIFVAQSDLGAWWRVVPLFAVFLASMVCNIIAIWPRDYVGACVSLDEHPEYLSKDKDELVAQLLSDTQAAIRTDLQANHVKWRLLAVSILLSLAGTLAVIGCILYIHYVR